MKVEIPAEKFCEEFKKVRGVEPSEDIVKFALAYNEMRNSEKAGQFDPFDAPGLRYVGEVSHERVNNGDPVPLFEPVEPEGRSNTNTLEGWTAAADRVNRKSFISANGREPKNREELYAWVYQMCEKAEATV